MSTPKPEPETGRIYVDAEGRRWRLLDITPIQWGVDALAPSDGSRCDDTGFSDGLL